MWNNLGTLTKNNLYFSFIIFIYQTIYPLINFNLNQVVQYLTV